jgi:pimeloyl-ACP methyl ester carboxylesterase
MTEFATSADGTQIAYDRHGSGPALVFVHGATQFRAFDATTAQLAKDLGDTFTTINYDRRGRGESGDTQPFSVAREIEDLAAVIEAAGGRASVFGMSSGGVLSLHAAVAHLPIDKLVLWEPPFVVNDAVPPIAADYADRLAACAAEDRREDAVTIFLTEAAGVPAEYISGMKQDPMWETMLSIAPTIAYDAAAMGDTMQGSAEPLQQFSGIDVPALVLHADDNPRMVDAAAALAAVMPKGEARLHEGAQHGFPAEAMAATLRSELVA